MKLIFPKKDHIRQKIADEHAANEESAAALKELELLLSKGDGQAHALAGIIYEFGGEGVAIDYQKARYCYEFAASAVGSGAAYLGLARIFFHGKGVPVDLDYAHTLYEVLRKDADEPIALLGLARIYLEEDWPHDNTALAEEYIHIAMGKGYVASHLLLAQLLRKQRRHIRAFYESVKGRSLGARLMCIDQGDIRLSSE